MISGARCLSTYMYKEIQSSAKAAVVIQAGRQAANLVDGSWLGQICNTGRFAAVARTTLRPASLLELIMYSTVP
jgi:hypothetical protein